MKKCPEGKILNPKTNRYVNKTGKIGTALLSAAPAPTPVPVPKSPEQLPKSPEKDLNNNVLNIIAKKADSATKRKLKEVNKHFKETVVVDPIFGRKNAEFLVKYLKKNLVVHNIIIETIPAEDIGKHKPHTSFRIVKKYEGSSEKIVFYRNIPGEIPEVIGILKYNKKTDLEKLKLSDVIKISKQKFVSDMLNNMNYLVDYTNTLDPIYNEWLKFVKSHVNK